MSKSTYPRSMLIRVGRIVSSCLHKKGGRDIMSKSTYPCSMLIRVGRIVSGCLHKKGGRGASCQKVHMSSILIRVGRIVCSCLLMKGGRGASCQRYICSLLITVGCDELSAVVCGTMSKGTCAQCSLGWDELSAVVCTRKGGGHNVKRYKCSLLFVLRSTCFIANYADLTHTPMPRLGEKKKLNFL